MPDLADDASRSSYAREVLKHTPVRSVLAMALLIDGTAIRVMTVYAAQPRAFDDAAITRAAVLAECAAIAVEAALIGDGALNLSTALLRSRLMGQAQGILIERHGINTITALQRLCEAGQRTNRTVSEVAAELLSTGRAQHL